MEATVLSLGKSVLSGAIDYAKSAVAEEVALQLGIQRDQAFIRDELEMMQSFLMAAHDSNDRDDKVVKTWVKQVRDVAYDVEDCLQDFAVRLGKKKKKNCTPRMLRERRRIAKEMKELRAKVEEVSQRNSRYQLIKASSSKPTAAADVVPAGGSTARATMPSTQEARSQHQDRAKDDLVRLVINQKVQELRVVAVWGTHYGPWVTSIIERACDHLKKKFECCALVDLAHPINQTELMRNIVNQFYIRSIQETAGEATPQGCQVLRKMAIMKKSDQLAEAFNAYLSDKCYLIVLNDISTIAKWEEIKTCFPDNKKGSRIIVSTEQVEVASLCAGTEKVAPQHVQLVADQTLYAFHCKGADDVTDTMEPSSSSNAMTKFNAAFKESELIGREQQKNQIVDLISKGEQKLEKISVWGMGGIGKTALVKDIYQNEKIKGTFDKFACVTILRPFNFEDLLKNLEEQLEDPKTSKNPTGSSKNPMEALNTSEKKEFLLPDILQGKKYLIVLDDVLSTTEWDAIKSYFPTTETASRIIITTRYESVAKHCSGDQKEKRHELSVLGDEDAKDLFIRKVFKEYIDLDKQDPKLGEEANLILRKCSGLPLAIVTIGGFLARQPKTALEWRKLNEHISFELEMNPELETIKAVLEISYHGLPYHLKPCFLYLSIFPENYKISRKSLVRRWTAEGYSRKVLNKSAEEVADGYFCELLDRCMILPTQKLTHRQYKESDFYQIHDLIRDIAISKSKEENFVLRVDKDSLYNHGTIRHLAITNGNWEGDDNELKDILAEGHLETAVDMSRVRSLTVFGGPIYFWNLDKMRLLRVLNFEGCKKDLGVYEINHIGKLVHLKYLSLRGGKIYRLPKSLGNLRQLETLDVRDTMVCKLPKTIINLRKLNYLRVGRTESMDNIFNYDEIEEDLPECMRHRLCIWTMLRIFIANKCCRVDFYHEAKVKNFKDILTIWDFMCCIVPLVMKIGHGVVAPKGLRRPTALHTLSTVNIKQGLMTVIEDIKRLTQLRKLRVGGANQKNSTKFFSALATLSQLESLSVHFDFLRGTSLDLDEKFSPPNSLTSLKLHGKLVALPKWFRQLKNLVKLKLERTRLKDHDAALQVLGELPNLAILNLSHHFIEVEIGELHFQGSFGSLVVLEINLSDIKYVKFEQNAVDKLKLLLITGSLTEGIEFPGIEFLPREVQLSVSSKYERDKERLKDLKKELLAQLSKNPNHASIPILKVNRSRSFKGEQYIEILPAKFS